MALRYHNITHDDMLNGEGLRVVLWVSGCIHKCEGCQNPITWNINSGLEFDEKAKNELYHYLEKDYISGLTLSGGDPLHPENRKHTLNIAKEVKEKFPNKTVWLYTGFTWEVVKNIEGIEYVDILVDGRWEKELFDPKLYWKGSSNQRVIDVQKSLKENTVILY